MNFKQETQYLGIQSVDQQEMIMNLEQRRREVRKHTQIRRTYNLDLEESTMARTRDKISKIANEYYEGLSILKISECY